MTENQALWVLLLLVCELFESWWQHASTMRGILDKIGHYFKTNIFLLFAMHPSLWLVLFIYVAHNFHGTLLSIILVMKASDLAFKLWLVKKLEENSLPPDFKAMFSLPLQPWMPWINVVIYPALLALALAG